MNRPTLDSHRWTTLTFEVEKTPKGGIAWITLNRPKSFNALSMECINELHRAFDALQHPTTMLEPLTKDHPRVIVLAANGKAFSGGVDIKAADRGIGGQAWDYKDMRSQQLLSRLIEKMRAVPQPIVCAIQGPAAGAGLALSLASDIRIATPSASFIASFVRLGLSGTDMGTSFFLPKLAGRGIASEMLLTGRSISAQRAYDVGLVNELVVQEDGNGQQKDNTTILKAARQWAEDMLKCSPLGLQLTKQQLNATADGGSLQNALSAENSHQILLVNDPVASAEAQAWLNAMMTKKQPGQGSKGSGEGKARL